MYKKNVLTNKITINIKLFSKCVSLIGERGDSMKRITRNIYNVIILTVLCVLTLLVLMSNLQPAYAFEAEDATISDGMYFNDDIVFEYGLEYNLEEKIEIVLDKKHSNLLDVVSIEGIITNEVTIRRMSDELDESGLINYSINVTNNSDFNFETNQNLLIVFIDGERVIYNIAKIKKVDVAINRDGTVTDIETGMYLQELIDEKNGTKMGNKIGTVVVRRNDKTYYIDFKYDVEDTIIPEIKGPDVITLDYEESFDISKYRAIDSVDGELNISVALEMVTDNDIVATLSAYDQHGNYSKKEVKIYHKEQFTNNNNGIPEVSGKSKDVHNENQKSLVNHQNNNDVKGNNKNITGKLPKTGLNSNYIWLVFAGSGILSLLLARKINTTKEDKNISIK